MEQLDEDPSCLVSPSKGIGGDWVILGLNGRGLMIQTADFMIQTSQPPEAGHRRKHGMEVFSQNSLLREL